MEAQSRNNPTRIRTVVVTGATGFVGKYICSWFSTQNWQVVGVSRSPSQALFVNEWIQHDLPSSKRLTVPEGTELIVHCAGQTHNRNADRDTYTKSILMGSRKVFETAKSSISQPEVVFLSSIKVMGEVLPKSSNESLKEEPKSAYGECKLEAEGILDNFVRMGDIRKGTSLRLSPVYGPGSKGAIGKLSTLSEKGLLPRVRGKFGVRSLVHVEDVVSAVAATRVLPDGYQRYCISDGVEYDLEKICCLLQRNGSRGRQLPRLPLGVLFRFLARTKLQTSLSERIFEDSHVSSELFRLHTGWLPRHTLGEE